MSGNPGVKNSAASTMKQRMLMKPEPKPISALPSALPIELIRIAARNALKRSAKRVASGTQKIRTTIGAASTIPIAAASRPLYSSHKGKNGIPNPVAMPKVA